MRCADRAQILEELLARARDLTPEQVDRAWRYVDEVLAKGYDELPENRSPEMHYFFNEVRSPRPREAESADRRCPQADEIDEWYLKFTAKEMERMDAEDRFLPPPFLLPESVETSLLAQEVRGCPPLSACASYLRFVSSLSRRRT